MEFIGDWIVIGGGIICPVGIGLAFVTLKSNTSFNIEAKRINANTAMNVFLFIAITRNCELNRT